MYKTILFIVICFVFVSCKKENYTTQPQISFLSITPSTWYSDIPPTTGPQLSFKLTDAEGDFGFQDTSNSFVYIRLENDTLNPPDSLFFPNLPIPDKSNLNVEVSVDISSVLPPPHFPRPFTDTLHFELYVKDFAGHKSNVIKSTTPFYYITP
jgi:hypothetical protein